MAHFAKLNDNNIVLEVNAVNNEVINDLPFPESEPIGVAFLTEWSGGYTNWKQTSYNNSFRITYAGIGYEFRQDLNLPYGAFISPKPLNNTNEEGQTITYVLNETTCQWEPEVVQ
jgi:hypothetical protein